MDGCRHTATSASLDAELPDWSRRQSLLHNQPHKPKQIGQQDPAPGSPHRRLVRFLSSSRIRRSNFADIGTVSDRHIPACEPNSTRRETSSRKHCGEHAATVPPIECPTRESLGLADVHNKLAQRFDKCVNRGCNHLGLPIPPGHPRLSSDNRGRGGQTGTPNSRTAQQAMQKDHRLSVAARTERDLAM